MGAGTDETLTLIGRLPTHGTVGRLTLLLLVLYGEPIWQLKLPVIMAAATGLAFQNVLRARSFWLMLAILQTVTILPKAYTVDNHKLLMCYWTWVLALSVNARHTLVFNARMLLGLCFALAVVWKLYRGEFLDGSFLHFTLLTDHRFALFAKLVLGCPDAILDENRRLVGQVVAGALPAAQLRDVPHSEVVALALSYWTLLSEAAIAIMFVAGSVSTRISYMRNALLLQFVILTYSVASVIGFGWLVTIMGLAQTTDTERKSTVCYVLAFVLQQLFLVPWDALLGI
jgi:hypothetical protein